MRIFLLAGLSGFLLSACAQQPENISAVPVPGDPYARFSCSQLNEEQLKVSQELANFEAEQRKAVNADAVGVLLLGLPLSSMSGGDKETAIAVAKGQTQEIERQKQRKNCRS